MGSPRLRLFGTIHVDRPRKVTDELSAFATDIDALFVELPDRPPNWQILLQCLLRTPAFYLGFTALRVLLAPVIVLLNRRYVAIEQVAAEHVSEEYDVPVHRVDRPFELIGGARRSVVAINWICMVGLAALALMATLSTVATILGVGLLLHSSTRYRNRRAWLVLVPLLSWGLLVAGIVAGVVSLLALAALYVFCTATLLATLDSRNEYMLERIADIAAREDYGEPCLVTGKAHVSGLIELADEYGLTVTRSKSAKWCRYSDNARDDPEPDDGDWADSVSWPSAPEPAMDTVGTGVGRRFVAAALDLLVVVLLAPVFGIALGVLAALTFGDGALGTGLAVGLFGTPLVYHPILEGAVGQTLGKRLAGLVVVRTNGSACTYVRAVVRHVLRPFEVIVLGLGLFTMVVSERATRIGDAAAGTVVVRTADTADQGGDHPNRTGSAETAKDLSADPTTSQ